MKWLRLLLIPIAFVLFYVAWYFWLAVQVPVYPLDEWASTIHYENKETVEFKPTTFDTPTFMMRVSGHHQTLGEHYINLVRWQGSFNPDKPAGVVRWNGEVVAYLYTSDKPVNNYHWHIHENMCVTPGAVTTTDLNLWNCVKRGYLPASVFKRYMLHYWLIPNPYGINEMANPNLK